MGDTVGQAWYDLAARQDQLERDLRSAEGKIKKAGEKGEAEFDKPWQKNAAKFKERVGGINKTLATIGIGIGLATVVGFFGNAIGAASDLNEEVSKAGVVFGASAAEVEAFAEEAATSLGQSKREALAAMGAFGNMFRTIGLGEPEAAKMAITLDQLASDMASFNNADPSDMLLRLRSGLSGEAEPLRQFGILLSEARVKAFAYANGIATVGEELTEAQKVQARYGVILQDTTLQQGDFARTSTGLANTQRKNAAIWENTLARIGQALLPMATALATFAGDVLPSVGDAILGLIHVAEPMVSLLLTLGGLWIEHAKIIVPAVALIYGVKLVAALQGATIKAKALTLAMTALRAVALLGIPVALEAAEAIAAWGDEMKYGKEQADALAAAELRVKDAGGDLGGVWIQLTEAAGRLGVPVAQLVTAYAQWYEITKDQTQALLLTLDPTKALHDGVDDLDESIRDETMSMQRWAAAHRQGAEDVAAAVRGLEVDVIEAVEGIDGVVKDSARAVPGGIAVELENGTTVVATSADALANLIPGAVKRAKEEAAAEALLIPGEIAAAILEGRDQVVQAGTGLADAATDPLTQAARVAELREQMKDLATVTAEEIENATPATIAADKQKYAELEILLASHLLRQDPKSKEAAQLLAKYANSEDPATQAAYEALMGAVEDRADVMALGVEESAARTGKAIPEALDEARADAIDKAIQMTQAVLREAQNLENPMHQSGFTAGENLGEGVESAKGTAKDNVARFGDFVTGPIRFMPSWTWGNNVGNSFANGLRDSQGYVNDKAEQLRDGVSRILKFAHSPDYTMAREIARNVAHAYLDTMQQELNATDALRALGGAQQMIGNVIAGPAAAPQPAMAAASGDTIYQLHLSGGVQSFGSGYELVDEVTRMGIFGGDGR